MKIEELLKEAFLSYEKDNLYDATVYLETILEIDEYNKRALIMLSKIYSSVEKYEIAIKYCEKAYKNYGNELEVIFIMGYLYQEMGKNRKALKYYEKYIEKEKNYHVYLNMGICYMDLKYFRKAHELIDKAIEIDIENPDGYFDKAECFIKMKKFDEAMKLYKKLKNMKIVEDYYIYMKIGDAYYSIKNIEKGKQENKEKLCNLFNLDPTKPLFSFIGRLLEEKGGDLLPHAAALALSENYQQINILILGSGNTAIENHLNSLLQNYKGNYNTFIGYNEELAHLIYAGSDFLLMPSRVEPCGLNQMYSLRYGTIPIVRRTGGLKDTVIDFGDDGNGICHDQATVGDVCYSIQRAVNLYADKKHLNKIRKIGMNTDHSWERVCQEYIDMYKLIINQR